MALQKEMVGVGFAKKVLIDDGRPQPMAHEGRGLQHKQKRIKAVQVIKVR